MSDRIWKWTITFFVGIVATDTVAPMENIPKSAEVIVILVIMVSAVSALMSKGGER